MSIMDVLRNRSARRAGPGTQAAADAPDEAELPIARYDQRDAREVGKLLSTLSQVELGAVESYERAHGARAEVLAKLRYTRGSEPLPGYDALTVEQIVQALDGADAQTVKAVRDYERKFQHRRQVRDEAARVLPSAAPSAEAARAEEARAERVREGFASRRKTASDLSR